ncbi:uncharacterized protein K02A2.6-like [Saccostrea cucullata]|uniref:uncharacterized protein K02A2.6-like n=1 Tax=Saccostrea cuccullata TaxID=36930 RepID=UPI002ED2B9BE
MRLRRFNVYSEYVPGKQMVVPDTLSRSPSKHSDTDNTVEEITIYVNSVLETKPVSDHKLEQIRRETDLDNELRLVMNLTKQGWPDHINSVPEGARDYFSARSELSIFEGILLFRDRIVIPGVLRSEILETIHDGHMSISKCRERAATSVWWPGLSKEIATKVANCEICQAQRPTQRKEPLKTTTLPERPWQRIAADLFEIDDKHYIAVMDYFSRYLEIAYLPSITSDQVIGKLKNIFARWGIPEILFTDNGTQFTSQTFRTFAKEYNFMQLFSSPHYPQANGEAESGVKIAKHILKQPDIFKALMAYRSTPIAATGVSPAELIMGQRIRTALPTLDKTLNPRWPDINTIRSHDEDTKERYRFYFDKHNAVRPLPSLKEGERVLVKLDNENLWKDTGVIKSFDPDQRTCVIETPRGNIRRNRRHVKFTSSKPQNLKTVDIPVTDTLFENFDNDSFRAVENPNQANEPKTLQSGSGTPTTVTRSGRTVVKPSRFNDFIPLE